MNDRTGIASELDSEIAIEPERYEFFEGPAYHFDLDRRGFLKAMGGGILILSLLDRDADQAEAQPPGGGRQRGGGGRGGQSAPQDIGAWLHIGEDGKIAVYTGKAEVGQNIRTSLSQAVAEELHAPIESIHMVMADTQLTPYDMGTFGSRSTPSMSPQLRRAAAAAREILIGLAAETWKVDRAELSVADGAVVRTRTKETLPYGTLTKGRKLTKAITSEAATTPAKDWKIAGTSVPKVDGRSFVNGQHQYASDVRLPGMWHGKVLRPPSFGAKLTSLDSDAAKAMRDVVVVRDGDFVGVAAPSESLASKALAALKAEWKPGPPISGKDLFTQLKKPAASGQGGRGGGGGGGANGPTGSIQKGLEAADVRLKQSYTVAYIAHAPLEPRAGVAQWQDGKLTVWTGSQGPFRVKGELVGAFGLSDDAVRVIVPDTGSGYGGKHTVEAAVEAARLARGRPAGQGRLDARGGVHLGLFPTRRRHRRRQRRAQGWDAHRLGIPQLQLGRFRDSLALQGAQPGRGVPSLGCPVTPGIVPGAGGHGESFRPRVAHGRAGACRAHRPAGIPPEEPRRGTRRSAAPGGAPGRGEVVRMGNEGGDRPRQWPRDRSG